MVSGSWQRGLGGHARLAQFSSCPDRPRKTLPCSTRCSRLLCRRLGCRCKVRNIHVYMSVVVGCCMLTCYLPQQIAWWHSNVMSMLVVQGQTGAFHQWDTLELRLWHSIILFGVAVVLKFHSVSPAQTWSVRYRTAGPAVQIVQLQSYAVAQTTLSLSRTTLRSRVSEILALLVTLLPPIAVYTWWQCCTGSSR